MILHLRETLGVRPRLRCGIVAAILLALLAFPCGPVATAMASDAGNALGAPAAVPVHSEHGEAECAHGAKKHENSCCKDCSSWLTPRMDKNKAAVLGHEPRQYFPTLAPAHVPALFVAGDREQRLTGPPPTGVLDGTRIYSRTKRYRI